MLMLLLAGGCHSSAPPGDSASFVSGAVVAGAPCDSSMTTLRCHSPGPVEVDGQRVCLVGERRCRDNLWSECEDVRQLPATASLAGQGISREAILGGPELCNGCDDFCFVTRDTPTDADLGDGRFETNGATYDSGLGGFVIGGSKSTALGRYAWVSSHSSDVVNKLNMETLTNDGVYRTGSSGRSSNPSRTTVDQNGYVYVANRDNASVTKIAGDLVNCVEINGIPGIQTSLGETAPGVFNLLGAHDDANRDECIIWDREINGGSGGPRALAIDPRMRLWVGLRDTKVYYVLDTASGAILHGPIHVAHETYGAAMAPDGTLWSVATSGDTIQPIDTTGEFPSDADVGSLISAPGSCYGIAVDGAGRIYTAQNSSLNRYDPSTGLWDTAVTEGAHGLSIHADGFIYVADSSNEVIEHDLETMAILRRFPSLKNPWGTAPDFFGHVWAPNRDTATSTVVDRSTGAVSYVNTYGPNYTYSDFTGYGFITFTSPTGEFTRLYDSYEACGFGDTSERDTLRIEADTPETSSIHVYASSGVDMADLEASIEVDLGEAPAPDFSGRRVIDIRGPFSAVGRSPHLRYFRIRVVLARNGSSETPIVHSYSITEYCPS